MATHTVSEGGYVIMIVLAPQARLHKEVWNEICALLTDKPSGRYGVVSMIPLV